MKIFISYSRRDAGDFANQLYESLIDEHQVFTDINKIQLGDIWSNTIEENISTCDIFVVIVTFAALRSVEVEKEVLQAQKENKKIIPCIYKPIRKDKIKWSLEKIQGIVFYDKYELARIFYLKINVETSISNNRQIEKISQIISAPDITIFINEEKGSSDFEYSVSVYSTDVPMKEMGHIRFHVDPKAIFHKIFKGIEEFTGSHIINREIITQGKSLYDELFPESLKQFYWERRDKINYIQFISVEPWIPWEIIKPWRKLENGNIEEDPFLCEKFNFTRWIKGKHQIIKEKIKNIKVVIPKDTYFAASIKEGNWMKEFAKSKNLGISFDSSLPELIQTLQTNKEIDILHFLTRGQYKEDSIYSTIELEEFTQFRPIDIIGKAMTFGQSHPIVIMNLCKTENQDFSLTGIQSWATRFLDAGASVFIGTLWSVNDETSYIFMKEFYNHFMVGDTIAESIRLARLKCKKDDDPSWLAYQVYGHPNFKIKL